MEDRIEIFGRNYQFITEAQAHAFEDFRMLSFTGQIDANTCERRCYEHFFGENYENTGNKEEVFGLIKRYQGRDTGITWIVNHMRKSITYDGLRNMRLAESLKYIGDENYPCLLSKYEFDLINKQYSKYFSLNSIDLNRKIIGYALKEDKYEFVSAVNTILKSNFFFHNCIVEIDSPNIEKLKEVGLLHIWFVPVYEECFKEILVGVDNVTVKVYKDRIVYGTEEFSMKAISDMHKTFHDMYLTPEKSNTPKNPHQIQILEFKVGCTRFRLEDMQKVIRTSKELIHGL